jgi:hypothetical protein
MVRQKHSKTNGEIADNMAELDKLRTEFRDEFKPCTVEEESLVEGFARGRWLSSHYRRLERATWEKIRIEAASDGDNPLGAISLRTLRELNKIGRCIETADKSASSAINRLTKTQARRKRAEAVGKIPKPASSSSPSLPSRSTGLFLVPKRS